MTIAKIALMLSLSKYEGETEVMTLRQAQGEDK